MVNWNEAWGTVFTGLIIVFVALIALVLIVWIFGKVSSSANAKTKEQKPAPVPQKAVPVPAPAPAAVPAAPASDDMDEIAAVITAALAMVLAQEDSGKSYVVKSIKRVRNGGSAWRGAGLSENVRPF